VEDGGEGERRGERPIRRTSRNWPGMSRLCRRPPMGLLARGRQDAGARGSSRKMGGEAEGQGEEGGGAGDTGLVIAGSQLLVAAFKSDLLKFSIHVVRNHLYDS
jgi:hypothetical protein